MKKFTKQERKKYCSKSKGWSHLLGFTKSGAAIIADSPPFRETRYFIQTNPESLGRQISMFDVDKYLYKK